MMTYDTWIDIMQIAFRPFRECQFIEQVLPEAKHTLIFHGVVVSSDTIPIIERMLGHGVKWFTSSDSDAAGEAWVNLHIIVPQHIIQSWDK